MGIFFFGHSTYKTEPSEKISAWHDFFSGFGCHFSFNDWTTILAGQHIPNSNLAKFEPGSRACYLQICFYVLIVCRKMDCTSKKGKERLSAKRSRSRCCSVSGCSNGDYVLSKWKEEICAEHEINFGTCSCDQPFS